jgi:hypothetical protein
MIHHTTTTLDEETFDWVSLDGEHWLPVNREPGIDDDEEGVRVLFEGDGNFKPMVFARSWLIGQGAQL